LHGRNAGFDAINIDAFAEMLTRLHLPVAIDIPSFAIVDMVGGGSGAAHGCGDQDLRDDETMAW
jgi:hypothetical protein